MELSPTDYKKSLVLVLRMARDSDYKVNCNMPLENVKMQSWPRIYLTFYNPVQCYDTKFLLRTDKNFGGTLFCSVF